MTRTKMHDPKCYELAVYFLSEHVSQRLKDGLAQHIQDAIEDWLTAERDRIAAALATNP